jgi:hypothetical protein
MVDNLYMYGPTRGLLVETPQRAATGRKGLVRVEMERQLLDAHASGALRVAIGRLSDDFGPNGPNSTLTALVLELAARGKVIPRHRRMAPRSCVSGTTRQEKRT